MDRSLRNAPRLGLLLLLCGCLGNGAKGTYHGANGTITLELKGGGKATFAALGERQECTWKSTEQTISLSCEAGEQPLELTRNADGTLTAGMLGLLSRAK